VSVAEYWDELLTVGLLGTDRRDVPAPPAGALADLAADDPQPSPSARLLQQVGACTAARRAGIVPGPPVAALEPPGADDRPPTPPAATATWYQIVADWPVLEDEWMLTVTANGWRLAPELIGAVLARHRTDGVRRARALVAAGPLAAWVVAHLPALASKGTARVDPDAVALLPELAITPGLQPLLVGSPQVVAERLANEVAKGLRPPDRAVLANLISRMRADALLAAADTLGAPPGDTETVGIALALAGLAHLRHRMLSELEPPL